MTNKIDYRLPPINTLALDFPLSLPQPFHNGPPSHTHGLSSPSMAASSGHGNSLAMYSNPQMGAVSGSNGSHSYVSQHLPQNLQNIQNIQSIQNVPQNMPQSGNFNTYSAPLPLASTPSALHQAPGSGFRSDLAEYTLSRTAVVPGTFESPVSSRYATESGFSGSGYSGSGFSSGAGNAPVKHDAQAPVQAPMQLLQQPSPSSSRRSSSHSALTDHNTSPRGSITSDTEGTVFSSAEASKSPEMIKEMKRRKKRQCPECHLYFSNLATHKSTHLNPTSRPHVCNVCNRGFARPNDLFRHYKCHWKETGADNGQFKCPFKCDGPNNQCSHSSGIFSRCDTYKNHLKAIHFEYPGGTKKSDRPTSSGRCGSCQKQFRTVDEWLTTHVETHSCESMKHEA